MNPFESRSEWAGRYPLLVIAHRGASGSAPENTLAAFAAALAVGADMVELDVHLSRDGEVMVIHNDSVDRRTNGTGMVADMTRAELQRLDAGSWFSERFGGEPIPALEEVLSLAKGRLRVNVEIKTGYLGPFSMDDLVDRTVAVVENQQMIDRVIFSSFDPPALKRIAEKWPDAARALLLDTPWQASAVVKAEKFRIIHCARNTVNARSLRAARAGGLRVNVWTVNREAEMERFIEAGADGIITDYPERLIRLLERALPEARPELPR
jgi:glycerophosphoryl diester phosphodiesterase